MGNNAKTKKWKSTQGPLVTVSVTLKKSRSLIGNAGGVAVTHVRNHHRACVCARFEILKPFSRSACFLD